MDERYETVLSIHLALSSILRAKIDEFRSKKIADSLALAFLDAELACWDQTFHRLVEAIEDFDTV